MPLSEADKAQTEAAIASLTIQISNASEADALILSAEKKKLQLLLTPAPPAPPKAPAAMLPPEVQWINVAGKKVGFRVFYYCGGFYPAPPPGSTHWDEFVAAVGQSVADNPTIYNHIESK